jgi:hypothetical protein
VLSELLAYAIGRSHGREAERRRRVVAPRPVGQDQAGPVEIACVVVIALSILIVLVLALLEL